MPNQFKLHLPAEFSNILKSDPLLDGGVVTALSEFSDLYIENRLEFFHEYTDHGINHIQSVLDTAAQIISENTYKSNILKPLDIAILVSSILLHDIGMHISLGTFRSMLDGCMDDFIISGLDSKTWSSLWDDYKIDTLKLSRNQKYLLFGDENLIVEFPNIKSDNLTVNDQKIIGEFIRLHHPRVAHEVALKGLPDSDGVFKYFRLNFDESVLDLVGLVARSHGMEIRDTYEYLEEKYERLKFFPKSTHIVYLMVILRISDYFQFDQSRVSVRSFVYKSFSSPLSLQEHHKHLATIEVQPDPVDSETLIVLAKPQTPELYNQLKNLYTSIQAEIDLSWATLGEAYGSKKEEQRVSFNYRRISHNLTPHSTFTRSCKYVTDPITLKFDIELLRILIYPLYGDEASFGVRELLQNATDACLENEYLKLMTGKELYNPSVTIEIKKESDSQILFSITDNGKGMTLNEIKKYFLTIGSTFRKSSEWQNIFIDKSGNSKIVRTGRFGIGVLAGFLIGSELDVETKSYRDSDGYRFKVSLDKSEIGIHKAKLTNTGTKITIKMDLDKYKELVDYQKTGKRYLFFEWYLGDKVEVKYLVNELEIRSSYKKFIKMLVIEKSLYNFKSSSGLECTWTENIHHLLYLVINDFIIPDGYELESKLIRRMPALIIKDNNNIIDLSLDRRRPLKPYLPQIKWELKTEIFKKFIASLLTYPTKSYFLNNILTLRKESYHSYCYTNSSKNAKFNFFLQGISFPIFVFSKDGFTLLHPYFMEKLEGKFINSLHYDSGFNYININITGDELYFVNENCSFESRLLEKAPKNNLSDNYIITFFSGSEHVKTAEFYYSNDKKKSFDKMKMLKIDDAVSFSMKEENRKGQVHLLESVGSNELSYAIRDSIQFKSSVVSYQDLDQDSDQDPELSYLFNEYFSKDLIIPYSIEERKVKFSKVFNDLKQYI